MLGHLPRHLTEQKRGKSRGSPERSQLTGDRIVLRRIAASLDIPSAALAECFPPAVYGPLCCALLGRFFRDDIRNWVVKDALNSEIMCGAMCHHFGGVDGLASAHLFDCMLVLNLLHVARGSAAKDSILIPSFRRLLIRCEVPIESINVVDLESGLIIGFDDVAMRRISDVAFDSRNKSGLLNHVPVFVQNLFTPQSRRHLLHFVSAIVKVHLITYV
jgi:hypothetical protein